MNNVIKGEIKIEPVKCNNCVNGMIIIGKNLIEGFQTTCNTCNIYTLFDGHMTENGWVGFYE